ncbi:membrane protein [Draconibacterium sediminis]|uniref:Membrane protein n=2 Tax=Draconibacterium sediminis TaxID=1544798 RepID=A0A0D8JDV4_9BACT|nr:membrane protein [Draconibacterium sediminis]
MLKIMKLTIFLMLITFVGVFASETYSQTTKLSLKVDEISLEDFLIKIENQSEFRFFYTGNIDVEHRVSGKFKNQKITEVLDDIKDEVGIQYEVMGRQIILSPIDSEKTFKSIQQQKSITGIVTDANGDPLPGVTVLIKGSTQGTVTNAAGQYTLADIPESATLQFSFIGMKTEEIIVGKKSTINLTMEPDAVGLDEIVVVGYGSIKKSDLVGSVASVDVQEAISIPTTNVSEMLRGRAAGVQVSLADARPGGNSNIIIRGKVSIDGGNEPLIIVDGIPYDNINDVASEDVKNIEILKDASSQAIYGARAANGVILITTKRGKPGEFKVNYHGYVTMQSLTKNFDLYTGEEFAQLRREAQRTDNDDEYRPDEDIFNEFELQTLQDKKYVDWEDLILQDAYITSHSLNFSGGGKNTRIFSSLNYFLQDGLIPTSGYERGNIKVNIDQRINDKLNFQINTNFQTNKQDIESNSLDFISISPLAKPYDENGNLNKYPLGTGSQMVNPLWNIEESTNEVSTQLVDINIVANYNFSPSLSYKLNTFLRNRNAEQGIYRTSKHSSGDDGINGRGVLGTKKFREFLIENIINYNPTISKKHKLDFTFVQAVNQRNNWEKSITKENFTNDYLGFNGNASVLADATRDVSERKMLSFMGRARYNALDRYLFTFTARADASSVFAENNKWGFFPAAAVAWKVHEESFLKESEAVNMLKLRLSYGDTGNEGIKPSQSLGVAGYLPYVFGGVATGGNAALTRLPNPELKWETTTSLNLGVDFGILNNLFIGTIEWYKSNTHDLLLDRILSGVSGYSVTRFNIGEVENKGLELTLDANVIRNREFTLSLGTTWSTNDNKILELDGSVDENGEPLDFVTQGLFIGEPIDNIRNYVFDGIFQEDDDFENSAQPDAQPGFIRVKDINEDGNIGQEDLVIFRKTPDWYSSVYLTMKYKGFDLFADVYIVEGATRMNSYLSDWDKGATLQGVRNGIKVDYYLPEKPSNLFPRPNIGAPGFLSSAAIKDASYVRLRTLSLGYTISASSISKIGLESAKFYVTGTNLLTFTDYKSYSPENNAGAFPDAKGITVGVKLGF